MKLLKQLYEIYSPSRNEKRMKKFLKYWISDNIPGAVIEHDNTGNLYITKGEAEAYPCVVAHLDQVQKTHSADFKAVETKEIIFGYSSSNRRQEGLGADDKNGIWVALKCLERYDQIKVAFFVGEEIGCAGSSKCMMSFFENCRFVLQCDRRGGGDLITNIGGWTELCSTDFLKAFDYQKFGYKREHGLITDVGTLKEQGLPVSCINISCGYYEPHTDHEFTIKSELLNCLTLVETIIDTCTGVYPHIDDDFRYGYGSCCYYGDDEYDEIYNLISDYLSYNPNAKVDEVYDLFHNEDSFLTKLDFQDMISECNRKCL